MANFIGDSSDNIVTFFGLSDNSGLYDGLGGIDTLVADTSADYLFDLENNLLNRVNGSFTGTIRNFEVIFAGSGNDILIRGANFTPHSLNGGSGNDTISISSFGIIQSDTFDGGSGIDVFDLSGSAFAYTIDQNANSLLEEGFRSTTISGFEHFIGGSGNDFIREVSNLATTLDGGLGDDTLATTTGVIDGGEVFRGGAGTDVLDFTNQFGNYIIDLENGDIITFGATAGVSGIEQVLGGQGNDRLIAGSQPLAYTLNGGDGSDTITAGNSGLVGGEVFDGGLGIDSLDLSALFDDLVIDQNTSSLSAGGVSATISGFERFVGGSGNDFIREVSNLATTLEGGLGDDTLATASTSIGGNEVFDGGDGTDLLDFSNLNGDFTVDLNDGTFAAGFSSSQVLNVEQVLAGSGNDLLRSDNGDAANSLNGGLGNDTIMPGSDGLRTGDVFVGGDGIDVLDLTGQTEDFTIDENAGLISDGFTQGTVSGFERVVGGSGDDFLRAVSGRDMTLEGGLGDDTLSNGPNAFGFGEVLDGGEGIDALNFSDAVVGFIVNLSTGSFDSSDAFYSAAVTRIEQVFAGSGDDVLTGGDGFTADTLDGGFGNDTISLGDLTGGFAFGNLFAGGQGIDVLDLSGANSGVVVQQDANSLNVLGTNATITGFERIIGGTDADEITGMSGQATTLEGGLGDDTIMPGFAGLNDGDDFSGGDGIDVLDLSGQVTDLVIDENQGLISAGAAQGTISGFERFVGGAGNDFIREVSFRATTVEGGLGDDTLATASSGTGGGETFDGGAGTDLLDFSNLGASFTVDLRDGTFVGGPSSSLALNIEQVRAGGGDDTIFAGNVDGVLFTLWGNGGDDSLSGGTQNDTINGGDGQDTIFGFRGNDVLSGNDGNDFVVGLIGDDQVAGNEGNDTIRGDEGNDTLTGDAGNDRIEGGENDDLLTGGSGEDSLFGDEGNDTLSGGGQSDMLFGGAGDDVISGGGGNFSDTIDGGDGNDQIGGGLGDDLLRGGNDQDVISGGNGEDTVEGGQGSDTLAGGSGNDSVMGGVGLDVLIGGLGTDTILGGDDNDRINGNGAQDTLFGEAGNDTLLGGLESDFIDGGTGNDTMRGNDGDDTLLGDSGNDTLFGDTGNDEIEGGSGNDLIIAGVGDDLLLGQSGNDTINSGGGDDTISGGTEADRFVFVANFGNDQISDFEGGTDTLVLGGYTADDVTQMALGNDLVLNVDNGVTSGTITIVNGFAAGIDVLADTLFL